MSLQRLPCPRDAIRLIATAAMSVGPKGIAPGTVFDCTRELARDLLRNSPVEIAFGRERFEEPGMPEVFGLAELPVVVSERPRVFEPKKGGLPRLR